MSRHEDQLSGLHRRLAEDDVALGRAEDEVHGGVQPRGLLDRRIQPRGLLAQALQQAGLSEQDGQVVGHLVRRRDGAGDEHHGRLRDDLAVVEAERGLLGDEPADEVALRLGAALGDETQQERAELGGAFVGVGSGQPDVAGAAAEELSHVVGPAVEIGPVLLRHAEEVGEHGIGQRQGEVGDEVEKVASRDLR